MLALLLNLGFAASLGGFHPPPVKAAPSSALAGGFVAPDKKPEYAYPWLEPHGPIVPSPFLGAQPERHDAPVPNPVFLGSPPNYKLPALEPIAILGPNEAEMIVLLLALLDDEDFP